MHLFLPLSLTDPDPDTTISLEGPDGLVEGDSRVQPGDSLVVFTADQALSPGELYTASLQLCTGRSRWVFQTAQLY